MGSMHAAYTAWFDLGAHSKSARQLQISCDSINSKFCHLETAILMSLSFLCATLVFLEAPTYSLCIRIKDLKSPNIFELCNNFKNAYTYYFHYYDNKNIFLRWFFDILFFSNFLRFMIFLRLWKIHMNIFLFNTFF